MNQFRQTRSPLKSHPSDPSVSSWWPGSVPQEDHKVTNVNKTLAQKYSSSYKDIALEDEDEQVVKPTKGVILPDAVLRVWWDTSILFIIIFQWFIIPFNLAFGISSEGGWYVLEVFMTSMFLLDLALNFNTGFYSKGNLVTRRTQIAKNYLKCWFWIDLLASVPYDWIILALVGDDDENNDSSSMYKAPQLLRLIKIFRFLRILKLIRIAKLKRIVMKLEDFFTSEALNSFVVILKLLAVIAFIAHWTACWFYYISFEDSFMFDKIWIREGDQIDMTTSQKYVASLYWALTTMTTVGYGDIVPRTESEKVYAMFAMIVACGTFAYTVGSIGSIVSKQSAQANSYRERSNAVNSYLKKHEIPADLQFRVKRYLEYVWENQKDWLNENEILQLLSEPLRDEVYSYIHGVIITACPIFTENYDTHFISQVSKTFDTATYAPGDIVLEEGELSQYMCFITSGHVAIYHGETNSTFKTLFPGSYFGEIAFFTGQPRWAAAKCINFVDILILHNDKFKTILEKFPIAQNSFNVFAKKVREGEFSLMKIKWYICKKPNHVATGCKDIIVNCGHEESKKKWLEVRKAGKKVGPEPSSAKIRPQKQNARLNRRYGAKNVIGKPRHHSEVYSEHEELLQALNGFVSEQAPNPRATPEQSSPERPLTRKNSKKSLKGRKRPIFTIIYESSDDEDDMPSPQREPAFLRQLAKRRVLPEKRPEASSRTSIANMTWTQPQHQLSDMDRISVVSEENDMSVIK